MKHQDICAGVARHRVRAASRPASTQEKKSKVAVEKFKQNASGRIRQSDSGRDSCSSRRCARAWSTDEAMYVERHDASGKSSGRLLNVEIVRGQESRSC